MLGERASKEVCLACRASEVRWRTLGTLTGGSSVDFTSGRLSPFGLLASTAVNQRRAIQGGQALPRISDETKKTLQCHSPLYGMRSHLSGHTACDFKSTVGQWRRTVCDGSSTNRRRNEHTHECSKFRGRCVDARISVLGSRYSMFSVQALLRGS